MNWLISILLVAGAAVPGTEIPSPPKPGRYSITIKSGDFDRVTHVHIPAQYKPETKPPLVLVLHSAGGNGTAVLDKDGWAAKADQSRFIAVAPDGLPGLPCLSAKVRTNPSFWNAGQNKPGSLGAAIDDVAFIRD